MTISGLSFFPKISIQNLHISIKDYNTVLEFENIQVQSPFKIKNSHITTEKCNIHISTDTNTSYQKTTPKNLNSKKDIPDFQSFFKYLPQKILIDNISLTIKNKERELFLSGIPLLIDKAKTLISLSSTRAVMAITTDGQKQILSGTVEIYHQFLKESQTVSTYIQFPPYMNVSGELNIDNSLNKIQIKNINLSLDENISKSLSSFWDSFFSLPVYWENFYIENLNGTLHYQSHQLIPENINGNLYIYSLIIGEREKPWLQYTSDIHIYTHYSESEQTTEVVLDSDKEPAWKLNWKYNHSNQNTYLDFDTKSLQGRIIQKLSPYVYNTFLLKQIEPFSSKFSLSIRGTFPSMEGVFQGELSLPDIDTILLNSHLNITPGNNSLLQIKWGGTCKWQKNPILFSTELIPFNKFTVQIQTEKFPTRFFQSLSPSLIKNALDDSLTDITINMKGDGWDNIDLQFKGQLSPGNNENEYPPVVPSEFHFQGSIHNLEKIAGSFHLSSENSVDLTLNPCKLYFYPLLLEGDVKTKIYLSSISPEFLPYYLPGKVEFVGKVRWDDGNRLLIQGTGSGEGLGIEKYILPEEVSLCMDTHITADFSNYTFDIEYLKMGFTNCDLVRVQKSKIFLPTGNHRLAININELDIQGSLNDLLDWGISEESQGSYSMIVKDFDYQDNQIRSGEIEWNIKIPNLKIPAWQIEITNLFSQSQSENFANNDLPVNINIDKFTLQKINVSRIEVLSRLKLLLEMELESLKGKIWNGDFSSKGTVQQKDGVFIGNFTGNYSHLDLSQFTEEVQPPWIRLSGMAHGDFFANINFTTAQLVDGDFNLSCPEGLTINRDVLLQLILYLQNVSIVQKQLEKLLGKEDPKPFSKGELTLGFKDNQATVSLLLTTPNINLAPIFYINADWKTLWSLITTPSGVQVEIK